MNAQELVDELIELSQSRGRRLVDLEVHLIVETAEDHYHPDGWARVRGMAHKVEMDVHGVRILA